MHVEIWSDIACPWCYIGKRRFEQALEAFEHRDEVRITWRSFELDPEAPAERPGTQAGHLAEKYGIPEEQARTMQARVTEAAAGEGLRYDLEHARMGNTFDAHRLLHLAADHGRQDELKERFLRAQQVEAERLGDHATLTRLAAEAGLPPDEVADVLAGDRYADAVRDDERTAAQLGISGVPFFVVDRAIGASGAQSPDVLLGLLREGWERRSPVPVVVTGEACGPDGC